MGLAETLERPRHAAIGTDDNQATPLTAREEKIWKIFVDQESKEPWDEPFELETAAHYLGSLAGDFDSPIFNQLAAEWQTRAEPDIEKRTRDAWLLFGDVDFSNDYVDFSNARPTVAPEDFDRDYNEPTPIWAGLQQAGPPAQEQNAEQARREVELLERLRDGIAALPGDDFLHKSTVYFADPNALEPLPRRVPSVPPGVDIAA
jgi:hypothetical protein